MATKARARARTLEEIECERDCFGIVAIALVLAALVITLTFCV